MSDDYKPKTLVEKLIQVEEDAKAYLLPISTKEWAEATGEKLSNYRMISIDVIVNPSMVEYGRVLRSEDDIRNYANAVQINESERTPFSGTYGTVNRYNIKSSMAKYLMVTKGQAEGASIIVDVKVKTMIPSSEESTWYIYMTGVGLVPKQKSESEKMMDLHDRLQDLHKNIGDDKNKQTGDYA
jgi:hypothetical protein